MLLKHIKQIHRKSRETYGSPRVHAEPTMGLGLPVNVKRVARLMRQAGVQGLYRRRRHGCPVRDLHAEPATDLVNRRFTVDAANRLWVTDITERPTEEASCTALVFDLECLQTTHMITPRPCHCPEWTRVTFTHTA